MWAVLDLDALGWLRDACLVAVHLQTAIHHGGVRVSRSTSLRIICSIESQSLQVHQLGRDKDWGCSLVLIVTRRPRNVLRPRQRHNASIVPETLGRIAYDCLVKSPLIQEANLLAWQF